MFARILAGGVAGAAAMFLLGWLIYGMLLSSYFASTVSPAGKAVMNMETPNFVPLIIAEIVFGVLFAFIFDYWASIRTFAGGAKGGAIIMFLMSLGFSMQMEAFFKDMHVGSPYIPMVVDLICAVILGALGGGAIGLINGLMDKQSG